MTDKGKRIAAAELIGWEWKGEPGFMCWHSPGGAFMGAPLFADHTRQKEDFVHVLPSYQRSYDAHRDLESFIDEQPVDIRSLWLDHLALECKWPDESVPAKDLRFEVEYASHRLSPAARLEAFGKTFKLW